ncbi:hypothetical protein BKI52_29805 [marine bacterium AO1-C]|nr:hypothetical protein BKI52_29805 [marine bacterium AO1-C]
MKKRWLFHLFFFLGWGVIQAQQAYYVDAQNGNDNNDGSQANPWKDVRAVLGKLNTNDTLILRGGEHFADDKLSINKSDITLKSFPGEMAHIRASNDFASIFISDGVSNVTLERLEVTAPNLNGIQLGLSTNNITIRSCKIHDVQNEGFKIPSGQTQDGTRIFNVLIEACEIYRTNTNPNTGNAQDSNGDGIDAVNVEQLTIRNCYFHDIPSSHAFYFKGGSEKCVAEGNFIENCDAGIALGFATDCQFYDTQKNPNAYGSIDCIVRNNVVIKTNSYGIGLFGALRPVVANNTLVDVAQNTRGGLYFESNTPNGCTNKAQSVTEATVVNNIILLPATSSRGVIEARENNATSPLTGSNTIDYNFYFHTSKTARFRIEGTFGDLATWQNYTQDGNNSMITDPQLTSDYHLNAGSPCIDVGTNLQSVTRDLDGNNRDDNKNDIGADEFNSTDCKAALPPPNNQIGIAQECGGSGNTGGGGTPTGIIPTRKQESNAFQIFPNITRNNFTIEFAQKGHAYHTFAVFNLQGQKVLIGKIPRNSQKITINVSKLSRQWYLLFTYSSKKMSFARFYKQ